MELDSLLEESLYQLSIDLQKPIFSHFFSRRTSNLKGPHTSLPLIYSDPSVFLAVALITTFSKACGTFLFSSRIDGSGFENAAKQL